jgi:hypothetical protein
MAGKQQEKVINMYKGLIMHLEIGTVLREGYSMGA